MDWDVKYVPEVWGGKQLAYPHVPKEHAKFAQSITVGNVVFLSGCVGQDSARGTPAPAGIEEQVVQALENARKGMENAGSAMENIVKTFFLVRDLTDYGAVRRTETEYYEAHAPYLLEHPPAATLIVVDSLARPEFLVEYEAIGVVDRSAGNWSVTYYPEYWGGKRLTYPGVPKEHPKFARTEVVGNLVFVSGCQALDHETVRVETSDFREQTGIVLDKLKVGMEETGGSLANLVKTNVLLDDIRDYPAYREVERAYFQEHAPELVQNPPASTVIHARGLPRPEFLVEVEAIGVVDKEAPAWPTRYYPGAADASRAVATGKLLFLSGCDGSDPTTGEVETDDFEAQLVTALDKVKAGLEAAGSSLDKVVKILWMLRDVGDYPTMRVTELGYYQLHAPRLVSNPPTSTTIALPSITSPRAQVQIDVTAVL